MRKVRRNAFALLFLTVGLLYSVATSYAQEPTILGVAELDKLVPTNFYFEGQLGPTQKRNAAAVRFDAKRHFIAALVDTSGYASNIRSKYEGFLIADTRVSAGGVELAAGSYGFGFTNDMKMNIFDLGGKQLHSVAAPKDEKLQSPRPLIIVKSGSDLRLYRGRNYVVIAAK